MKYNNPSVDYTNLPDPPKRKRLKQNFPTDHKANHKLARFSKECREGLG